jgi:outer membrane protein TolC
MLAAILAASAVTATPPPMTLAQALDFAMAHNQTVLSARAQWMEAGASLARDRASQLPLVQGSAQSTMDRQSVSSSGSLAQFGLSPQPNFSQNTAEVQGSQSVFNLQNELTADQARHSYDQAAQNFRLTKEQTVVNVETSYYTYVQDVDLVALAQSDLVYEKTLYDIANANFRSGRVAGIDRLKAQVQLTTSQENLSSSQADAEDARENLAQLVGTDSSQTFVVPSAIPIPVVAPADLKVLDAIALVHSPDLAIARDNLDIAVLNNGLVDAPNRPTVTLQSAWGNQLVTTVTDQQRQQNEMLCGAPSCSSSHFYSVSLNSQILLPLIDWGTLHAAHRGARASIDAESAAFETARRQALIDVDQAVRRLAVDDQNLGLATQNADVAKQAAQIAQVQYRVGLGSQLDVSTAEQTYLQAAKQLLSAQVGYVLAADRLKLATGTLVTE